MRLNCRPVGLCILVFLFLLLFLWLGTWQVNRAEEKTLILDQSLDKGSMQPQELDLDLDREGYESIRYLPVKVAGEYDSERQFLLDNQVKNRQVGYSVFTPLKVSGSSKAVLVDRGWVPQGLTRQLLPDLSFEQGESLIYGSLYSPFSEGVRLGGLDNGEFVWPRVIQFLDFEAISERLGYDLLPVIIRLSENAENGYLREWKTVSFGPKKHIGYAVQWYGLAAAMMVILMVLGLKQNKE